MFEKAAARLFHTSAGEEWQRSLGEGLLERLEKMCCPMVSPLQLVVKHYLGEQFPIGIPGFWVTSCFCGGQVQTSNSDGFGG